MTRVTRSDSHAHVIQNGFKMQLELEKAKSVSGEQVLSGW